MQVFSAHFYYFVCNSERANVPLCHWRLTNNVADFAAVFPLCRFPVLSTILRADKSDKRTNSSFQ